MGLFDFARDIGRKIFGRGDSPEESAAKIQKEVAAANLGITGLQVAYADGVCSLAGDCPSVEVMEKAVLIAGNIEGVSEVNVDGLKVAKPATAAPQPKVEYYLVQKGDTLSKIAKHYFGDANKYPRIFEANREVIKDADLIFPGQKIRIPLD